MIPNTQQVYGVRGGVKEWTRWGGSYRGLAALVAWPIWEEAKNDPCVIP